MRMGGGGSWLAPEKAEVGVVFPVKTELQHVRGEGCSDGYAEKTEIQKHVCVWSWIWLPTHTPNWPPSSYSLNSGL